MFTIMYLHPGCQPDLTMMYAGTKQAVVKFAEVTKVCLPNVTHTHTHACIIVPFLAHKLGLSAAETKHYHARTDTPLYEPEIYTIIKYEIQKMQLIILPKTVFNQFFPIQNGLCNSCRNKCVRGEKCITLYFTKIYSPTKICTRILSNIFSHKWHPT